MPESSRALARDEQVAKHDLQIGMAERELSAAGFNVIKRGTEFVKFVGVAGGFWLLVAER